MLSEMTSTIAKRPAPNIPPKPSPRHSTSPPDSAAVATGNGNADYGGHDVTSSASSSTDEAVHLVAELPDKRRIVLLVDARYVASMS